MSLQPARGWRLMEQTGSVAVIIAAYNVAETIGLAVRSALDQPETAEVIVVDDASHDDTAEAAREAGQGDPRLTVIRNDSNAGPARARNTAIARSVAPFIAILDGDDILLPGRFAAMFAHDDWDFCADNIVFFSDVAQIGDVTSRFSESVAGTLSLDFASFVAGNLPAEGKLRGELGFLKPVMRRSFLEEHGLSYIEECRLGEDFLFYAEALAAGARYTVIPQCGYAALVRANSLSGNHSVADLAALHRNERLLLDRLDLSDENRALLKRRVRATLRKLSHREVLASKASNGLVQGVLTGLSRPTSFVDIARDHWRKWLPAQPAMPLPRSLLPVSHFSER